MSREELKELIVGPIATVPTPFDDDFEVDYGRMHELTQQWIEEGLVNGKSVLKVAAAMGEGPMLRDDEWPYLLGTTVRAADGRVPVMCGLHYKDTKRTIEDAKRAQDMGAMGLQVCPPIFNAPSQDDILDYFGDLSDAIDIAIMVYHTHWLGGGRIEVDTILRMANFEQVAAIKWSAPEDVDHDEMTKFSDTFNVIANGEVMRSLKIGAKGYINLTAESYPPHDLRVWELVQNGQWDEAEALYKSVEEPLRELSGKMDVRSGGQARLKKGISALMGKPVGSSRPPSKPLNEREMDEIRELLISFGWPVQQTAAKALVAV